MEALKCGFARIDITPGHPNEVFLDGYGNRILPAQSVRDPIHAGVCAMKGEAAEFIIISLEICGLSRALKEHMCDMISLLTGLKRESFALCVTHTHAAPACGVLANLPVNMMYWNQVAEKISRAVSEARTGEKPGSLRFASGGEFTLPVNRRGKEDINRNIQVCAFFDGDNLLQGVIASASCHAVCNRENSVSADFPGVLTGRAAEKYPGVPFLYLQSRGADIDPPCYGEEGIEKLGNELADRVFEAIDSMKYKEGVRGEVKSLFKTITVPMSYPPKEELRKAVDNLKDLLLPVTGNDAERRYPEVELQWHLTALKEAEAGNTEPLLPVDLQVAAVGSSAVFAFAPFELLTVTGNAVEVAICAQGIDPELCFVTGYANGTNGYLCPAAESGQDGYETRSAAHWYGLPECSARTEPVIISTLAGMARSLLQEN